MAYAKDDNAAGPATHALIIGVGKYAPNKWDLSDLGSPHLSAQEFARWMLTEYRNPKAPLASLEILWSPSHGPQPFSVPGGQPINPEPATLANVKTAFDRWLDRCDRSVDNVAVFYFCGHGMWRGYPSWLLLDGFAKPESRNYDDAINVTKFMIGMGQCKARRQLYLLDACRNTPEPARNVPLEFGTGLIDPDDSKQFGIPRETAGIAPAEGQSVFGEDGRVSCLTHALLSALRGAGWDDRDNPWNEWLVQTDTLLTRVTALLEYEHKARGQPYQRAVGLNEQSNITFHHPQPEEAPRVPLLVREGDSGGFSVPTALEVWRNGNLIAQRPASRDQWEPAPMLPAARDYVLQVTAAGQSTKPQLVNLRPAYRIVDL